VVVGAGQRPIEVSRSRSQLMALLYSTAVLPRPGRLGAMAWNRGLRLDLSRYALTGRGPG
jgi:hypothetical protein